MPTPTPNLPTGIRRTENGYRVAVRVHHGPNGLRTKRFGPATSLLTMRRWREDEKAAVRNGTAPAPKGATLRASVADYLEQVATMPTIRHRRDDLGLWLRAFGGDRVRTSITAGEIRAQLETWRVRYAANTVNHRRTALMHLWSVLDGKSAPNPARDVPRYHDDSQDAPPRALSQTAMALLIDAMRPSQTRARLDLFRWTGWPPAQMAKLQPVDIRWDDAVFVRARRKGKGVAGAWLPLLPQAWSALREFKRLGCWGAFSTSSARTSFRRAARKARRTIARAYAQTREPSLRTLRRELLDVTSYQCRHTFLTLVAGLTGDDRAVKVLAQHADIRQTHRYTEATADPRAAAALANVALRLERKVTERLPPA